MASNTHMGSARAEGLAFRQILLQQNIRYPKMQMQDLYKLIYQATFGSEHAIIDAIQAKNVLEQEVAGLAEGIDEPIIERISAGEQIVRVNLRPFIKRGGDVNHLLDGFLRTAREYKGSVHQFRRTVRFAQRMAEAIAFSWTTAELLDFLQEMETRGFPAVHHSETYRVSYQPAYRIILRKYLALEQEGYLDGKDVTFQQNSAA